MTHDKDNCQAENDHLVLVAVNDDDLWLEISGRLESHFRVRRETNGLRAIDVMMLLKPSAVIAETGLPGLSGILLARLINHNKYLTPLPVGLIFSRKYLIEEFWASESGAVAVVPRDNPAGVVDAVREAINRARPISDTEWDLAEKAIIEQGGPAAAVAVELERQLIGASIVARLGEIEIGTQPPEGESRDTIPAFIGQALSALASVLEFAQAGITLINEGNLYTVDNQVFAGRLNHEAFIQETQRASEIYLRPEAPKMNLASTALPPVRHELPGPSVPASTFFALPLTGRSGVYGLLSLMTYKQIAVREYYLQTLSLIGAQLAVNLERALFYEEVRRLSVTDPLTSLTNRRALIGRLETEFRRSIRYHAPLSIAVCDLDDFKHVNDTYGHLAGDAMLKAVAGLIRASVREIDLASRWGGEEMAMLFPQTDLEGALIACERVRREVEENRLRFEGNELKITLSIGIATLNTDRFCPRSADALIGLADRALYYAKNHGKNRVSNFTEL